MGARIAKLPAAPRHAAVRSTSAPESFETLSAKIRQSTSIPDKVADLLRGMILSGQWGPGDRIVETQVARKLKIGQPAVREALGKLEEAGLVKRLLNAGCIVTQLSRDELSQIFRVRIELESLAVELATESTAPGKANQLKAALANLQKVARKAKAPDFYKADFEFHRTIWQFADNRFLEKALIQLVIPLFNAATIEIVAHDNLDFIKDAAEHAQIVEAILTGDKVHACKVLRSALGGFWNRGLELIKNDGAS